MIGAMYLATSGALVNQKRMEVLSNNLANINTTGYKNDRTFFRLHSFPQQGDASAMPASSGNQSPHPPQWLEIKVQTDFSSGSLKKTGNSLDLALTGDGFFCVQTPEGLRYTRNGQFTLNLDGELVTAAGDLVQGEGGAIEIDGSQVTVDQRGNLSVDGNRVDRLRIVRFAQPDDLKKMKDSLFATVDESITGLEAEEILVSQGFIEQSNVSPVQMMTEMIEVLRGYESYQKAIRSIDDATAKAINDVGRI